jgi:hypothetical protein
MKSLVLSTVIAFAFTTGAMAWGDRGHSIVAEIALHHLDGKATAAVQKLLGNASLVGTASWADEYKFDGPEGKKTYDWHFADIDITHQDYQPSDCPAQGCLVSALVDQTRILGDATKPDADRRLALLFVVHLVGDSTQPFHCGQRNHDLGGNLVKADFEGTRPDGKLRAIPETELHGVWDDSLIDNRTFAWGTYADELEKKTVPQIKDVTFGPDFAVEWINQCHHVVQKLYAELPAPDANGFIVLGPDYQKAQKETLDRQLATGGLRLAALLNGVLGGQ